MVNSMESKNFKYQPLKEDELLIRWEKHKKIIESFIKENQFDCEKIYINEKAVMAVIAKVDQRRKYFEYFHGLRMSEYKEGALICFWYVKLHPICAVSKDILQNDMKVFNSINEKLAVYYLLVTLKSMLKQQGMSTEKVDSLPRVYLKELMYSFTYRDLSKEALILLIESMAIFLGLNPYKTTESI